MLKHASYYVSQIHCRDAFVMLVATAQQQVEPASKAKPGDLATPGDAGLSPPLHLTTFVLLSERVHVKTRMLLCVADSLP